MYNKTISEDVIIDVVKKLELYDEFMMAIWDMDISGTDDELDKMNEIRSKILKNNVDETLCYLKSWIDE